MSQPTLRREGDAWLAGASSKKGKHVELPPTFIWGKHRKNRKIRGLRTLIVKGSGVVFTHGEGNSTPRIRHKGRQPFNQVCKYDFKMFYFPFFMSFCVFILFVFFIFLWSTRVLPSIAMRKLDLRSSFRIERWLSCYYLFFLQDIF